MGAGVLIHIVLLAQLALDQLSRSPSILFPVVLRSSSVLIKVLYVTEFRFENAFLSKCLVMVDKMGNIENLDDRLSLKIYSAEKHWHRLSSSSHKDYFAEAVEV